MFRTNFRAAEHPKVKAFAIHPGVIETDLVALTEWPTIDDLHRDTAELSAATLLYISEGKADWLNGRYYSSNWDIEDVEKLWKERIVAGDALKTVLSLP